MLVDVFTCGPILTNCVLIGCEETKKGAIFDAPFDSLVPLSKKILEWELAIEALYLTHSHWDHTGDAKAIKETFDIPVYVHESDKDNLVQPGSDHLPLINPVAPCSADAFLEEGQEISVGNISFAVIHTPGHTPGGVCFYSEKKRLLISGDTLFAGSIGRLDLPTSQPDKMWDSLARLAKLPGDTRVIPGHCEETTIESEGWLTRAKELFGG